MLVWKKSTATVALSMLLKMVVLVASGDAVMPFADANGRGEVLWPLRVALSGSQASPGPLELLETMGKEEALRRIAIAIEKLS